VSERIEAEVAIIGAGPAGTATAAYLGQLGVKDVVLLDKHPFPRDKTCASGVSPNGVRVLRELQVWDDVKPHAYPITGARIVTPQGREVWVNSGPEVEAIVCLRRTLDNAILQRAERAGVRFVPHFTAGELLTEHGRVTGVVARDGREVRARFTVIAGGTHCDLIPRRRKRKLIQAIMGWWDGVPFRANHVEMLYDRTLLPLYGWLFPEGDGRVNIGIAYEDRDGDKNAREMFRRFLDTHFAHRLGAATQVGAFKGHPITYSYRIANLTSPGRIVVGESGRLTHPATAEGIYQGMRSGMIAACSLRDVLLNGENEGTAFAAYERRCRETFRTSFLCGGVIRTLLKTPFFDLMVRQSGRPIVRRAAASLLALL
jgi:geranylgeranyl reductase family protein